MFKYGILRNKITYDLQFKVIIMFELLNGARCRAQGLYGFPKGRRQILVTCAPGVPKRQIFPLIRPTKIS